MSQPLPFPLPYDANALEPVLSEQAVILHDSIASGYVQQFPKLQAGVPAAVEQGQLPLREQLRTLSFQGSGYVLHNIYFANMAPVGTGGTPGAMTMRMITSMFTDLTTFQDAFLAAANAVEGPGWAIFGWLGATSRPYLLQCEEHNNKTIWGLVPILIVDVWEHAYMLDYGSNRTAYTTAWWKLINWRDVEQRANLAIQGRSPMLI